MNWIMILVNGVIRYPEINLRVRCEKERNQIRNLETGLGVIEKFRKNNTSLLIIINLELDIILRNDT